MKQIFAASLLAGSLAFTPTAFAQNGNTVGAAGGAVAGAVVGGPVGAVVGGVAGAAVGTIVDENSKPAPSNRHQRCLKGSESSTSKHCKSP